MRRFLMALLCCLLLAAGVRAAGEDITVTSYQAEAKAASDGLVQMTVTVQMTIPTPVSQLDLPVEGSGASVSGYSSERASGENGDYLRLTFDKPISGANTFVLSYTLNGTFTEDTHGQTFKADLVSPGWAWPISAASFRLTMPAAFAGQPSYTGGYYGDNVADHLELTNNGAALTGQFTDAVRDHDSLTVSLALPAGYFTPRGARGISSSVSLILVLILGVLGGTYWFLTLRSPVLRVPLRPLPPDGITAGELPALLTGDRADLALQAVQWASLGYLGVSLSGRGRVALSRRISMGSERRRREQAIFGMLFDKKTVCDGASLHFRRLAERYAAATRSYWNRRLFSRESGSPALLRAAAALAFGAAAFGTASSALPAMTARLLLLLLFSAVGLAAGVLLQRACLAAVRRRFRAAVLRAIPALVLLAVSLRFGGGPAVLLAAAFQPLAVFATLRGGRRSPAGGEAIAQALGFRRYLANLSPHQALRQLGRDGQYFYKLLPFAEAVGEGERFARQFGEAELEPCDYLALPGRVPRTAAEFYRTFRGILAQIRNEKN